MNDIVQMRADGPLVMQWSGADTGEAESGGLASWLGAGGMLLAWTAIALLLTSA